MDTGHTATAHTCLSRSSKRVKYKICGVFVGARSLIKCTRVKRMYLNFPAVSSNTAYMRPTKNVTSAANPIVRITRVIEQKKKK